MGLKEAVSEWGGRAKEITVGVASDLKASALGTVSESVWEFLKEFVGVVLKSAISGVAGAVAVQYLDDFSGSGGDGGNGGSKTTTTSELLEETADGITETFRTGGTAIPTEALETTAVPTRGTVVPNGEPPPFDLVTEQFLVVFAVLFVASFAFFAVRTRRR